MVEADLVEVVAPESMTPDEGDIRNHEQGHKKRVFGALSSSIFGSGRQGKGVLLDEVCEIFGWDRKHAIRVLNGRVGVPQKCEGRGAKRRWGEAEERVILEIGRRSEHPCGVRLKETLPSWLWSYEKRFGVLPEGVRDRILGVSGRTLERILSAHRARGGEAGARRGREVLAGVRRIERVMPFEMLGFDCDNGSAFLNEIMEGYLRDQGRAVDWTRSRAYKKNDQAHVEQKNFTHVRQLLGYARYGDVALLPMVESLYREAWLPLRNFFTPVMKLREKVREGSRLIKRYDQPAIPCDRILGCAKVSESVKEELRNRRAALVPMSLSDEVERRLGEIFEVVSRLEQEQAEMYRLAGEALPSARSGRSIDVAGRSAEAAPAADPAVPVGHAEGARVAAPALTLPTPPRLHASPLCDSCCC